jgi:hypothetical protein
MLVFFAMTTTSFGTNIYQLLVSVVQRLVDSANPDSATNKRTEPNGDMMKRLERLGEAEPFAPKETRMDRNGP